MIERPRVLALAGALCVGLLTCAPLSAHAQPAKPSPSSVAEDSDKVEARARFDEGIKLGEAGDHEAARLKFRQAYALLKNSGAVLYNLARAERLSNHPVEAFEHYRLFVELPPDPKITAAQRHAADEALVEISKKIGQLDVKAPPGARITLDGRAIDTLNTGHVPVTVGKHVVEAITNGKTKSVTVDCAAGVVTAVNLADIDTTDRTAAAAVATPVAASTSESSTPKEQAPSFWTTGRIVGAGVVGAGLGALGVGLIFHFAAASSSDDADTLRAGLPPSPTRSQCLDPANGVPCAQLRTALEDRRSQENLRTGFLIGGGALVVGGAALFLLSSPKREKSDTLRGGARLVPIVTDRQAGLVVTGRF